MVKGHFFKNIFVARTTNRWHDECFCKILFFSKVIRYYIIYKAEFNQTELRPITTAEVGQPPSVDPVGCGLLYPRKGPSSLHSSKTEWSVALTSLELVCSN